MPVQVSLHSVALSYFIQASCWLLLAILLVHVSFSPALTSRRIKCGFSLPRCTVEPETWPSLIILQFPPAFGLTSAVSVFYFLSVRISASDAKTFGSFQPLYCSASLVQATLNSSKVLLNRCYFMLHFPYRAAQVRLHVK